MAKDIMCATILLFALGIISLIRGMASENLQVLVNESAVISCSPNRVLNVQWHHTSPGKSFNAYVYAGGNFYSPYKTDRFRVYNDPTTNIYTLVITNVTQRDAGLYECKDDVLSGVFGSTQLIVLDSGPVCNSNMHSGGFIGPNKCNIQHENMTFSCAVSFAGKTSPSLIWRSLNGNRTLVNSICTTQPNHINCSLTLKADPEYDGSVFICETKESNGARFNCSTEVIKVQYFSADYENSTRKVHDNVSCIANSNLEPRYNWTAEQNGQYLFLSSEKVIVMEEPGIYRCDVEYSIRNNNCSFRTSVVNASEATSSNGTQKENGVNAMAITIAIVGVFILIALIILLALYIIIRRRKREKESSERTPPELMRPLIEVPTRPVVEVVLPRYGEQQEAIACQMPDLLFSFETKASRENKCPIYGLAILGNELFTISRGRPEFEVYDFTGSSVEGRPKRCCQVDGLKDPRNIVACRANDCLYIENMIEANKLNEIIRVSKEDGAVLCRWEIAEDLGRISITTESKVLVTVRRNSSLLEYTPEGKVRHNIKIEKQANINHLRHALLMDTGHYVLCYGDEKDTVKGVCIVDKRGRVFAKFGDENANPEMKLTNPLYLATDARGSILVVDDKRIVLLNRQLHFERVLLKEEKNMRCTFRVCLDSERDRLLVADNEYCGLSSAIGRVHVYSFLFLKQPTNKHTWGPNGRL